MGLICKEKRNQNEQKKFSVNYTCSSDHELFLLFSNNQQKDVDLGEFSISLAVKDLNLSLAFYKKLGFRKVDGAVEQNWIILKNGSSKIGLFQGMFPKNTLTFRSDNVLQLQEKLKKKEIKFQLEVSDQMPSAMTMDPDGNPILFDQNK